LIAWRIIASLPDGARWLCLGRSLERAKTPADYPPFAAQFGIEGKVPVDVVLDPRRTTLCQPHAIAGASLTVNGVQRHHDPSLFETIAR
jgi:hypothetical protein